MLDSVFLRIWMATINERISARASKNRDMKRKVHSAPNVLT